MCLGVPSKIIALDDMVATVEAYGQQRQVSLMLLTESVELGDYLLIQAGGFAAQKIPEEQALSALSYIDELMDVPSNP